MGTHPQEVTRQKLKLKSTMSHKKRSHRNNHDTTNTLIKLKTINFQKTLIFCHKIFSIGILNFIVGVWFTKDKLTHATNIRQNVGPNENHYTPW